MICVYRAGLPTDAHLLLHWLRRNGIPAEVRGDLMTARGELPVWESSPSVWVATEHELDARALVAEFELEEEGGEKWACPGCGEENEPTFASCWSCNTSHPEVDGPTSDLR